MPAGQTRCGNHSITEPWKQRTQKQTLLAASKRLRERVEETAHFVANISDGQVRSATRRCLIDAENLIDVAERLLKADWIER